MIVYMNKEHLFFPTILCDACDEIIDGGSGNVFWLINKHGDLYPYPFFAHKLCRGFDKQLEEEHGGKVYWENIGVWLQQLADNFARDIWP